MTDDGRGREYVEDRFDRWWTRFLAKGLDRYDLQNLRADIDTWAEWCDAFAAVGEEHAERGRDAEAAGNSTSAGEHYLRASMYCHFGSFAWFVDEDRRETVHRRGVELFEKAGPHLDPAAERIEAPCPGGVDVPGFLRVPSHSPDGLDESPLVILLSGLDSTKEEQHTRASDFHARGVATLSVDGPGQGEAWYTRPMTPEYHEAISAAVDHAQGFDGVDASRLGVYGVSIGGFYAPHVAANDDRFDACVGLAGPFSVGAASMYNPSMREGFLHACHTDSLVEADDVTERMTLHGDIENLTAPSLMIAGGNDTVIPPEQTERIAERAPNGELLYYPDGDHVCKNRVTQYRPYAADWMRERLS
ncbi:alpha/beta hydrolase family protein [Haloplanus litoreus]|uniref:Alpha/beta hydrolase family protein n=2 Tax=Haloplanus litoreus TaxID=767515 RepID=A0ABD6A1N4_9EURY